MLHNLCTNQHILCWMPWGKRLSFSFVMGQVVIAEGAARASLKGRWRVSWWRLSNHTGAHRATPQGLIQSEEKRDEGIVTHFGGSVGARGELRWYGHERTESNYCVLSGAEGKGVRMVTLIQPDLNDRSVRNEVFGSSVCWLRQGVVREQDEKIRSCLEWDAA